MRRKQDLPWHDVTHGVVQTRGRAFEGFFLSFKYPFEFVSVIDIEIQYRN